MAITTESDRENDNDVQVALGGATQAPEGGSALAPRSDPVEKFDLEEAIRISAEEATEQQRLEREAEEKRRGRFAMPTATDSATLRTPSP